MCILLQRIDMRFEEIRKEQVLEISEEVQTARGRHILTTARQSDGALTDSYGSNHPYFPLQSTADGIMIGYPARTALPVSYLSTFGIFGYLKLFRSGCPSSGQSVCGCYQRQGLGRRLRQRRRWSALDAAVQRTRRERCFQSHRRAGWLAHCRHRARDLPPIR